MGPVMILGPTMDPTIAAKISLRIPHLALRVSEHAARAQIFAERLYDLGLKISYPGPPHHPGHELVKEQRSADYGFGGLLTLDLGEYKKAEALMDVLQNKYHFGYMAVSLGYFDTLRSAPAQSTSSEMTDTDLENAGISDGLVRLSLGYTGSREQHWSQLEQGLHEVGII